MHFDGIHLSHVNECYLFTHLSARVGRQTNSMFVGITYSFQRLPNKHSQSLSPVWNQSRKQE